MSEFKPGQSLSFADIMAMRSSQKTTEAKDEAPDELTREGIAKMKRADVVEHLEAHGLTEDDCEGVKVGELRDMLTNAVFSDL